MYDLPFYNEKHEAIFLGWLKDVSPATIPFDFILKEKDLVIEKLGEFLGVNDVNNYLKNLAALDACMYSDWFRIEDDNTLIYCINENEADRFKLYQDFTKNECLFDDREIKGFYHSCHLYFQGKFGLSLRSEIYNHLVFFHSLYEKKWSINEATDCCIRIGCGDKILLLFINMWNSSPYEGTHTYMLSDLLIRTIPDKVHNISMWHYEQNMNRDLFCDVILNRLSGIMLFEKNGGRFSLSYQKEFMRSNVNYRDRYSKRDEYIAKPFYPYNIIC